MTIAWMRLVSPAAALSRFDELPAAFSGLLDKNYLREFYSDALLSSDAAKKLSSNPTNGPFLW